MGLYILLYYLFLIYFSISLYVIIQGYIVNTVQMTNYVNWHNDFITRVRLVPALPYWILKTPRTFTHSPWQGRMGTWYTWDNLLTKKSHFIISWQGDRKSNKELVKFGKLWNLTQDYLICSLDFNIDLTYLRPLCFNMKLVVVYIVLYIEYLYVLNKNTVRRGIGWTKTP